ncbi:hypothetical protein MHYP_G00086510 [Metynnis hypsauchen]
METSGMRKKKAQKENQMCPRKDAMEGDFVEERGKNQSDCRAERSRLSAEDELPLLLVQCTLGSAHSNLKGNRLERILLLQKDPSEIWH